jgi:hypothetical protein
MELGELENWDDRLIGLTDALAAAGKLPVEVASYSSGVVCVARLGLSIPGVIDTLRQGMEGLATIAPLKDYMLETLRRFDTDILLGTLVVETILGKSKNQEGDYHDE